VRQVLALFDVGLDDALRQEGTAREIVSRVQQLRKKAALSPQDLVEVFYSCADAGLLEVLKNHMETIKETTRVELVPDEHLPARMRAKVIIEGEEEVNGAKIKLTLTPAALHLSSEASAAGKPVEELAAALEALDLKEARAALAGGQLPVAGVSRAADQQVFFTLGALLAANKTPL
jgi:valyl-tRNA synthetase